MNKKVIKYFKNGNRRLKYEVIQMKRIIVYALQKEYKSDANIK